jgi:hypothetical protein
MTETRRALGPDLVDRIARFRCNAGHGFVPCFLCTTGAEAIVAAALSHLEDAVRHLPRDRGDETWDTVVRQAVINLIRDAGEPLA